MMFLHKCSYFVLFIGVVLTGCGQTQLRASEPDAVQTTEPFVMVLGVAQDAGYPQAACRRDCCAAAWADPGLKRLVSSMAIVDPQSGKRWLIDATPDFREQLHALDAVTHQSGHATSRSISKSDLTGVFLTHAHIGHYTGLTQLGREVIGDPKTPVFAMPRMADFLTNNGPWNLLVEAGHIEIMPIADGQTIRLNDDLTITPMLVPHRDEFSETVGYRIEGPDRSVLFIPDIDKWSAWDTLGGSIEAEIARVDVAYLDGTFFASGEIPGRDMSEIPHPFIEESLDRFAALRVNDRAKIRFIHFNHTNPVVRDDPEAMQKIQAMGMRTARQFEMFALTTDQGTRDAR